MKQYLNKLPKDIHDLIYLISRFASKRKAYAYLVGGIVRDLILGIPNLDLDIVIQRKGLTFASEFARRHNAKLTTHPRFGTATLIMPNKIKLDISTARLEVYPEPASLPIVRPGTIKEDLARRDFTINALAIDLLPESFGNLVDCHRGRQDLEAGVIRILHDLSFIDDPTRIIRAVRFEQRLKFRIEPHSLKLLKKAAKKGMLRRVSPHRLRDEITLILKEPLALKCIRRLGKLVKFDFIHPKLKLNKATLRYLSAIESQINWFNVNSPEYRSLDNWLMYFNGLLNSLNKRQLNQVCGRFGLCRREIKRIISYNRFPSKKSLLLSRKNISPSRIYRILEPLSPEVVLLIKARYKNKFLNHNIEMFFRYYNKIRPYVSGKDLSNLGLKPGPDYKKILNRLLALQLDGRINSRQVALKWIRKWLSSS